VPQIFRAAKFRPNIRTGAADLFEANQFSALGKTKECVIGPDIILRRMRDEHKAHREIRRKDEPAPPQAADKNTK